MQFLPDGDGLVIEKVCVCVGVCVCVCVNTGTFQVPASESTVKLDQIHQLSLDISFAQNNTN